LKRRTSINSPTQFHKEKEMADFRKWFLALAVVALLSSFAAPAFAQAVTCSASAGVPPVIRSEGVAELVGDVVLNCTGAATPGTINVQIFLNAFVTSKWTKNGLSEALLLLNEPSGAAGSGNPINVCPPNHDCTTGGFNAFQGQLQNLQTSASGVTGYTSIVWTGIPFTPPGSGTAVIRITNVRADALSAPPAGGQFIPQTVSEFVAINGVHGVAINPSQLTVAYLQPGVLLATSGKGPFVNCTGRNVDLLNNGDPAINVDFAATLTEGFASSFKIQSSPAGVEQSTPGTNYFTESGFYSALLPSDVGTASNPTRFFINITGLASGVSVYLPTSVPLFRASDGKITGAAQLVTCDSTGTTCKAATADTTNTPVSTVVANLSGTAATALSDFFDGGTVPLTNVSTTGNIYYEVTSDDPFTVETVALPITVAFQPGLPPTTAVPTVTVGLAPQNTDTLKLATDPIPRFGPSSAPGQTLPFPIGPCVCNLMFPWVVSVGGFDTGIGISNTSMDPFNTGTVAQHGTITYHFYGTATGTGTSPDVPAGTSYGFSITIGDSANGANIPGMPNFAGYVIASANFQYCHGFAFISGFGIGPAGVSQGYVGLEMDNALPARTGSASEVLGH
jgi:hypothetical protein